MSSKAICGLTPRYLSDPSPHNALLAYLAVATLALLVLKQACSCLRAFAFAA